MHDYELEAIGADDLRSGIRLSVASIVWTLLSSSLAVVIGVASGSLVLVAFGLTGLLDAGGSVTITVHFRHAVRHEAFSERKEQRALRVVTAALFVIGVLTIVESVRRLVVHADVRTAPAGIVVAAISIFVLALLAYAKVVIARRIPSHALLADGWLSATGCLLAGATVAGTALTAAYGWWWADPVAAAAVSCGAIAVAAVMHRPR